MFRKLTVASLLISLSLLFPPAAPARPKKIIVIDDFSSSRPGPGLPKGWDIKENKGKAIVRIERQNGNNFLHLISKRSSFTLNKELDIDLRKYPILSWRWKVLKLPREADVRRKEKDDQAAQIYMHFAKFPRRINFWEIGYIWDTSAPRGSILPSQQLIGDRVQYIVIQSGPAKLGEWISERRNVYQDHKKLFGKEPPALSGIGLMIDSDNTGSSAECYLDDLVLQSR